MNCRAQDLTYAYHTDRWIWTLRFGKPIMQLFRINTHNPWKRKQCERTAHNPWKRKPKTQKSIIYVQLYSLQTQQSL